jgi:hypothetical protein
MLRQKLIAKHKTVLTSLSASQNAILRRLYLKEEVTDHENPSSEEEALEAFYRVLVGKGIFLILITLRTFI